MKHVITIIILIPFIYSCYQPVKSEKNTTFSKIEKTKKEVVIVDEVVKKIEMNIRQSADILPKEELFAKFFSERVSFHIDESPDKYFGDKEVSRMIVTSIDDTIARITYKLDEDISEGLIQAFGTFKFKALNITTKVLSENLEILIGKKINPMFTKYQLKWEQPDKTIIYRHLIDSVQSSFICYEELPNYKQYLKAAESKLAINQD